MLSRIIVVLIVLVTEIGLGYYSFVINGKLLPRFLFFLFSAGIVCLIVIKGIRYVLPNDYYNQTNEEIDA